MLGERIRSTVEGHPFSYIDATIRVTVSLGVAVAEADMPADYEQMSRIAAIALQEAKMTGRNRCVVQSLTPRPFEQAG